MCRFQELYNSSEGYIIRCAECRHYQIMYGGIVLSLNEKEYLRFAEVVLTYKEDMVRCNDEAEVPVPVPRQGVHLLLNEFKLSRLHGMLETAHAEAIAQNMLQLFYS